MSEKDFQNLVEEEIDARIDYHTGTYSSEKRVRWQDAADELSEEFRRRTGMSSDE